MTEISEDCLHVNVYRAPGTSANASLPVLVYIHGGSFIIGSKDELVIQPGGLILQSVAIGKPVIVVTINYRLGGKFEFADRRAVTDSSQSLDLLNQRR